MMMWSGRRFTVQGLYHVARRSTVTLILCGAALLNVLLVPVSHAAESSRYQDPFERLRVPATTRAIPTVDPRNGATPQNAGNSQSNHSAPVHEPPKLDAPAPIKKTEITASEPNIKITGRLQIDARRINSETIDGDNVVPYKSTFFDIRRARVDVKGMLTPSIKHKFSIELVDSVKVKDAYLELAWQSSDTRIRAGQFSYPFSSENLISNRYYEFLEAATISDTLSPSRDRGIALVGKHFDNKLFFNLSLLNGTGSNRPGKNEEFDYVVQAEALPVSRNDGNIKLWIGGAYATGKRVASVKEEIAVAPESQSGLNLFAAELPADVEYTRQRQAVDAKLLMHSLFVGAEVLTTTYTFEQPAKITGGYIMAGYFLTGEQRQIEEGLIERQPVINPITTDSGWGAWEIAVRYSWFTMDNNFFVKDSLFTDWNKGNDVDPAKMAATGSAWSYAVNWHPTKHTRMMFNWIESKAYTGEQESAPSILLARETAILVRGQIEF